MSRPLIVGFGKFRNELLRAGNLHRCLVNLRKFCDTIVACDDASTDGTRELLIKEIPAKQLLLVEPDEQDFRAELAVKTRMMRLVDELKPHWIWWADADEELEPAGVDGIRKMCAANLHNNRSDGYRVKYLQLWRSKHYIRTDDGFADGDFLKLWPWSPNLKFGDAYGTHHQQYPTTLRFQRAEALPWRVVHWGNYGVNLRWKCIQYYGGLGGVPRHLDFSKATYALTPPEAIGLPSEKIEIKKSDIVGGIARPFAPLVIRYPKPEPFTKDEQQKILAMCGLKREPSMFTVVIPTHNRAWALPQTLRSLIDQTYQRWVAVVLDDGSTDGTPDLMEEWQERDPRIFYARYPKMGAVAVNEIGMSLACEWTEWWARLGSDDYFEPHKLELDALALTTGHAEWVYGPYRVLRGDVLGETCNKPMTGKHAREVLLGSNFTISWANIAATTSLLRKVKERHGNFCDPRLMNMEDFLLNVRLARFAAPMWRCRAGDMTVLNAHELLFEQLVKIADHDAIWRTSPDGASSNAVQTGNEDTLTREIIAEENARWPTSL